MTDIFLYESVLDYIKDDEAYKTGSQWGESRNGHPEGSVSSHIKELEQNLEKLCDTKNISDLEKYKLLILINVHDTFKIHARPKVAITNIYSHASLAKDFLSRYLDDKDLLNMVQYHDENYALYKKHKKSGQVDKERLEKLFKEIKDWRLFMIFIIIDNCTKGKGRSPLKWFMYKVKEKFDIDVDETWILE